MVVVVLMVEVVGVVRVRYATHPHHRASIRKVNPVLPVLRVVVVEVVRVRYATHPHHLASTRKVNPVVPVLRVVVVEVVRIRYTILVRCEYHPRGTEIDNDDEVA